MTIKLYRINLRANEKEYTYEEIAEQFQQTAYYQKSMSLDASLRLYILNEMSGCNKV